MKCLMAEPGLESNSYVFILLLLKVNPHWPPSEFGGKMTGGSIRTLS